MLSSEGDQHALRDGMPSLVSMLPPADSEAVRKGNSAEHPGEFLGNAGALNHAQFLRPPFTSGH